MILTLFAITYRLIMMKGLGVKPCTFRLEEMDGDANQASVSFSFTCRWWASEEDRMVCRSEAVLAAQSLMERVTGRRFHLDGPVREVFE